MARILVQRDPFDVGAEFAAISAGRTDIGGIGCFVGTVRGVASGQPIISVSLEHYPPMTARALERIAAEAERRWSLHACTIIHRVGELVPGDAIVLVLAASSHRAAALDATAFLIDWLKTRAPFWKKERFVQGGDQWVETRPEDETAAERWQLPAHPPGASDSEGASDSAEMT